MTEPGVHVVGLDEMRAALKKASTEHAKALRAAHREVSKHVAAKAKSNARLAGGVWAKAAPSIRATATTDYAAVGPGRSSRAPMGNVAFWGARARTGWFANPTKYAAYPSQHPEWVGNTWDAASFSEGPYVINYTVAEEVPEVLDDFGDAIEDLYSKAFPDA